MVYKIPEVGNEKLRELVIDSLKQIESSEKRLIDIGKMIEETRTATIAKSEIMDKVQEKIKHTEQELTKLVDEDIRGICLAGLDEKPEHVLPTLTAGMANGVLVADPAILGLAIKTLLLETFSKRADVLLKNGKMTFKLRSQKLSDLESERSMVEQNVSDNMSLIRKIIGVENWCPEKEEDSSNNPLLKNLGISRMMRTGGSHA